MDNVLSASSVIKTVRQTEILESTQHWPESWVKLKPVSPVLLPGASRCPPPANMAVRCGDIPRSAMTHGYSYHTTILITRSLQWCGLFRLKKYRLNKINLNKHCCEVDRITHKEEEDNQRLKPASTCGQGSRLTMFLTCDSVWDAEESSRPVSSGKRLSVVPIPKAHPQQLLPYCFIP